MIAVIFEAELSSGAREEYLRLAAELRPQLAEIDGFVSIERFASLTAPERLLSLSFWRDEEAVRQWRTLEAHREAQHRGRSSIFSDYRLRVTDVLRDYGRIDRKEAPRDSQDIHGG